MKSRPRQAQAVKKTLIQEVPADFMQLHASFGVVLQIFELEKMGYFIFGARPAKHLSLLWSTKVM